MNLKNRSRKNFFYQWDTNQHLIVEDAPDCQEVHFCHRADIPALVCRIYEADGARMVDVPNIFLQQDKPITAYLFSRADDSTETRFAYHFPVRPRPKPEDYVYTETEVLNYSSLDKRLADLEGEGLANAVASYLEENPVEVGATAEEAAQIQKNKEDIQNLSNDKLDADQLPEAVNEALAQAKASGEFKGDPGATGKDGISGEDGYTPVRGKDYWTAEDKESILSELSAVSDDTAIVNEGKGSVVAVSDSLNRPLRGLTLYGKTTQDGTPTPEAPVELVSAGASGAINTTVMGKNWNATTYTSDPFVCSDVIHVIAGVTYTVSVSKICNALSVTNSAGTSDYVSSYNTDWLTFTFEEDRDVRLFALYRDGVDASTTMMLEVGPTKTAYEPYKGQTLTASTPNGLLSVPVANGGNYTDENGQQWMCDEIDFSRGVRVKRVRPVDMGELSYVYYMTSGNNNPVFYSNIPDKMTGYNNIISDSFVVGADSYWETLANGEAKCAYSSRQIAFRCDNYTDVASFKAAMSGRLLYYALAEPIETSLSAEELAQYAALRTYYPNTTVYNDGGAGLKLGYTADTKNYIDNKFTELQNAILSAGANI